MKDRGQGQLKIGVLKLSATNAVNYQFCKKVENFMSRYCKDSTNRVEFKCDFETNTFDFDGVVVRLSPENPEIEIRVDYYTHQLVIYHLGTQSRMNINFEIKCYYNNLFETFKRMVDLYQPIYSLSSITQTGGQVSNRLSTAGKLQSISYTSTSSKSTLTRITYIVIFDPNSEDDDIVSEEIHIKYYNKDGDLKVVNVKSEECPTILMSNCFIVIEGQHSTKIRILHETP